MDVANFLRGGSRLFREVKTRVEVGVFSSRHFLGKLGSFHNHGHC